MNRRRLFGLIVVVPLLFAIAASQATPLAPQQTASKTSLSSPVSIPFELVNRLIILKVKINNSRPLSFVLDTGDQYAIVNLDLAKELGLNLQGKVQMGGAGSELSIGAFVKDATFTIPGLDGFSQPVNLALPIGNLASRIGRDFDGIIGSEFIKQFVLELDYQAQTMRLHDKDKFIYSGPGESIPVQFNHGHPIIEGWVTPLGSDPIKGKFVIDIGSSGALSLTSPFVAERQLLSPDMKTVKAFGTGAGGEISGRIGRVSELRIGNYRLKTPFTLFSQDKKGAFASDELEGNIGSQVTSRFRLFLDYSHDRLIFEPNSTFARPFDRSFSGVRLQADGKDYRTFRITDVLENSPATEAGLLQDDVITSIDGTPAAQLTLARLTEMFERPQTYKLTVRRGNKIVRVKLTPRQMV